MNKRVSILWLSLLLSSPVIIRACEANQKSSYDKELKRAIEIKDVDAIRAYKGNGINAAGSYYNSPLSQGVTSGSIEIVDALLEKGAKPNAGRNIITIALDNWKEYMAHHLLTCGFQPDITTAHAAISNPSILTRCMPPKFDINAQDDVTGNTLLLKSLEKDNNENVSYLLLRNGARTDIPNKKGWLPIHGAVMKGLFRVVTMILQQNKNCAVAPGTLIIAGETIEIVPLELYSIPEYPDDQIADALVKAGASAEKVDLGRVLLNMQKHYCIDRVFNKLRALGVCTTTVNKLGQTPLMIALSRGFESIATQLIKEQDSPKTEDNQKTTLLHFAAKGNLSTLVKTIVTKYGISVDAIDKKGDTPFTITEFYCSHEFSDALEAMKPKEEETLNKRKSDDSEQMLLGKKIRFVISKDYENDIEHCDE